MWSLPNTETPFFNIRRVNTNSAQLLRVLFDQDQTFGVCKGLSSMWRSGQRDPRLPNSAEPPLTKIRPSEYVKACLHCDIPDNEIQKRLPILNECQFTISMYFFVFYVKYTMWFCTGFLVFSFGTHFTLIPPNPENFCFDLRAVWGYSNAFQCAPSTCT